jgi:hypothetical protein
MEGGGHVPPEGLKPRARYSMTSQKTEVCMLLVISPWVFCGLGISHSLFAKSRLCPHLYLEAHLFTDQRFNHCKICGDSDTEIICHTNPFKARGKILIKTISSNGLHC